MMDIILPQLREVEITKNMDSDGYEVAKFNAISQPSEREYLNAILQYLVNVKKVNMKLSLVVGLMSLLIAVEIIGLFVR